MWCTDTYNTNETLTFSGGTGLDSKLQTIRLHLILQTLVLTLIK